MILIHKETGAEVKIGEAVKTFRNDFGHLEDAREPHKPGSTGRIYVRMCDGGNLREMFPSVCGLEWSQRDEHKAELADAQRLTGTPDGY